MIRPRPRPGPGRSRAAATVLTVLLLLGAQAGLRSVAVPAFASGREVIRELDPLMLERFVRPPLPPEEIPETEIPEDADEEADEPSEPRSFEQEVGLAMEELERRFSLDEPDPTEMDPLSEAAAETERAPGIADEGGAELSEERFESLFGVADEVVAGRVARGRAPAERGAGLGLGITESAAGGSGASAGGGVSAGPAVTVAAAGERGAGASGGTASGDEATIERPDESDALSEPELLAEWLRSNPSELPVGIRAHVNFEPAFLTSTSTLQSDGTTWEIYLMYNEILEELHVVLVNGSDSVYLIDRGFQRQSRALREGTVRRADGTIVAVDSRVGAAASDRTQEYYDVFLAWWETAKQEVGAP